MWLNGRNSFLEKSTEKNGLALKEDQEDGVLDFGGNGILLISEDWLKDTGVPSSGWLTGSKNQSNSKPSVGLGLMSPRLSEKLDLSLSAAPPTTRPRNSKSYLS